jgi:CRP-like cAMP-binding protein
MDMQVDPEQLAKVPLLEGLGSYALGEIAEHSVKTYVRPGIRLVAAGESGFSFSMILSGKADVRAGGETVATLGSGDVFGEMAIVTGAKRNADVVATSAMVLASMMVWDFRDMVNKHTEVQERLDQLVADRTSG